MNNVATIVLGGGKGTRLFPLTQTQCKPALTVAGKYRLIDFAISNAILSGCNKLFVITQFLSSSLHKHISTMYQGGAGSFSSGFIDLLTAEQKPGQHGWFQGTADAVRQNLDYICETSAEYFLILSGDQLYSLNFQKMMQLAESTDADLVIAALPIEEHNASRMGLLKCSKTGLITDFVEKPTEKNILDELRMPKQFLDYLKKGNNSEHLGSMGIYLFKRQALIDLLQQDLREDFGKHLLPTKIQEGNVFAYIHEGYWEDIGTIKSFFDANIALTQPHSEFNIHDESCLSLHFRSKLPGAKVHGSFIKESILCDGVVVEAQEITHSILGPRSVVKKGSIIQNTYVMGHDYYSPPARVKRFPTELMISENCVIKNAIVDKHVFIGKDVQLINKNNVVNYDGDEVFIRDGIIVVPRGASIPDGFEL